MNHRPSIAGLLVLLIAGLGVSGVASAQSEVSGPTVSIDKIEVSPGDEVVLTMTGFEATSVTMSICGNNAARGSVDCNITASRARELAGPTSATVSKLTVPTPPAPCPCVVRVSSQGDDEIAIAPITIVGHPVAPVVEPSSFENPLVVSIAARPVSAGFSKGARSSLGGATAYEATVTVRNKSTAGVERVAVTASAGRDADDDLVDLELGAPRSLEAGQTWQQVVTVELPAPVYGNYEWRAVASGVGTSVTATTETSHTPILFWILVVFLTVDLLVLAVRFVVKRVRRRRTPSPPPAGTDQAAIDRLVLDEREPEFAESRSSRRRTR